MGILTLTWSGWLPRPGLGTKAWRATYRSSASRRLGETGGTWSSEKRGRSENKECWAGEPQPWVLALLAGEPAAPWAPAAPLRHSLFPAESPGANCTIDHSTSYCMPGWQELDPRPGVWGHPGQGWTTAQALTELKILIKHEAHLPCCLQLLIGYLFFACLKKVY